MAGCGSGVPGDAVVDVAGNPISTQAFNHWMYVAAKSQAAQSPGQPVIVPNDPPNFTNCIAQVRKDDPEPREDEDRDAAAPTASSCSPRSSSSGAGLPDQGLLVPGRRRTSSASRSPTPRSRRRSTRPRSRVPDRRRVQHVPQRRPARRSQTSLYPLPDQRRSCRSWSPSTRKTVTQAEIQAYYNNHLSQFGTQETRNMKIVLARTGPRRTPPRRRCSRARAGRRWSRSTRPTRRPRARGGVLNGVTKSQEDAALTNAAFAAPVNKLIGPVKGQFGYYVFEVTKITPATQQIARRGDAADQAAAHPQQSQTAPRRRSTTRPRRTGSARRRAAAEYAMADCKGYKAPKTATTSGTSTTG